jgi:ribose transport system permease protein
MTAATAARPDAARFLRRNAWTIGVWLLFALGITWYALIIPTFGPFVITSIAKGGLTLAILAIAQGIVVINGGVDLSIGSMLVLVNCVSARFMDGQDLPVVLLIAALVLIGAALADGLMGLVIHVSRVPDIVVTLAMSFVWAGIALLILKTPGGGSAVWLKDLVTGSFLNEWIPKASVVLVVVVALIWIPLRRSRLGLSIYAIGSSELAAFRSGVSVARTRIAAYAVGGLFGAMGGLSLTMSTGIGAPIPGPYLLASVAAVVLGGVTLGGGKGGLVGPIVAVFILRLMRTDLTLLAIDPNVTSIVEGTVMVAVVMLGAFLAMRERRP